MINMVLFGVMPHLIKFLAMSSDSARFAMTRNVGP